MIWNNIGQKKEQEYNKTLNKTNLKDIQVPLLNIIGTEDDLVSSIICYFSTDNY